MNLRKKEPMLESDWPYDQRYDCKCADCEVDFAGPKHAHFCWECVSDVCRNIWLADNGAIEIIACDGCGAMHPDQRCIGCHHDFFNEPGETIVVDDKTYTVVDVRATELTAWAPTNELRFIQRVIGGSILYILQQKWTEHIGHKTEWRNVPTESET